MFSSSRSRFLLAVSPLLFLLALKACGVWKGVLVVNTTESVPLGIYYIADEPPSVGSLVEIPPPQAAVDYAVLRWGQRPDGVTFLKPIVAASGDHVDTTGADVIVNGVRLAAIQDVDSEGLPLPRWRESRTLAKHEFFVVSTHATNSLDSRYFGPVRREDILAVQRPLLVW